MTNGDAATATDLPFFVVFLHICKIVVPIGFEFFLLFIEIFVSDDDDERFHMFASNGYFF